MIAGQELVLVGAVAAVGVLHTVVPDHWVPITLIGRQQGWTKREVARAALVAGTGHTVSTLFIGLVVWIAGVAFATKFGNLVSIVSSIALVAFGAWIAVSSLRELRTDAGHDHHHGHEHHDAETAIAAHQHSHETKDDHYAVRPEQSDDAPDVSSRGRAAVLTRHVHAHRHDASTVHIHLHDHGPDSSHDRAALAPGDAPVHAHRHRRSLRTTLLLILGSSPMVEGIPAFFAAAKYGPVLIAVMAVVFAFATIATYIALCVSSAAGLQRVRFGALERYGEVLSGGFIAIVGLVFLFFPLL